MVWMRCSISFPAVFADIGDELVAALKEEDGCQNR
jgi:hypothetical protein